MKEYKCPICENQLILNPNTMWLTCTGSHGYKITFEMYKELDKLLTKQMNTLLYGQTDTI